MIFCRLLIFFLKSSFPKTSFKNTIKVSNTLDPDLARHFVKPNLGPNFLEGLSADDKIAHIIPEASSTMRVFTGAHSSTFLHL